MFCLTGRMVVADAKGRDGSGGLIESAVSLRVDKPAAAFGVLTKTVFQGFGGLRKIVIPLANFEQHSGLCCRPPFTAADALQVGKMLTKVVEIATEGARQNGVWFFGGFSCDLLDNLRRRERVQARLLVANLALAVSVFP